MSEITTSKTNATIDKLSQWCVLNPRITVCIGILIVLFGVIIEDLFAIPPVGTIILNHNHYATVIYHFLVILGEAIIVMFILHMYIEKSNSHAHAQSNKEALDKMIAMNEEAFSQGLFSAVLKDKIPAEVVQAVLQSEFFNTNLLRKKLLVSYIYKGREQNTIIIEQRIGFDMVYISGTAENLEYPMRFALSDTPLAKYKFIEAGYKNISPVSNHPLIKLNKNDNFDVVEKGKDKEKDVFQLKEPIQMTKNQPIHVEQVLEARYDIDEKGMVDSYHVNQHTLDVSILFDLPSDLEVNIYPTFPEKFMPAPEDYGTRIEYNNISFLVPGQGFSFSIKKQ